MTETHYVNRVNQSPFQKLEADKLAKSENVKMSELALDEHYHSEPESTQPDPEAKFIAGELAVNIAIDPVVHQAAKDLNYVKSAEPEELPDDNIGNLASAPFTTPASLLIAQVLAGLHDPDIEFKRQVIAAFRHLGLDVRKHFGV